MLFPTLILALILQAAPATTTGPAATTAELDAQFTTDLHDKNVDHVLTLYAPDAIFVQPDGTEVPSTGLRKLYEQVTTTLDSVLHLNQTATKHSINTVIEDGTYTEDLRHRDTGKVDHVQGTYRFTFHRAPGGAWLFSRMEWH